MRQFPLLLILATLTLSATAQQSAPLYIFGGQGHKTFLGCLNCSSIHPKSVWNDMSEFGFKNDFGVWNPFREFINPFSGTSMCNEYAGDPPIIVDAEGNAYGRMTVNEFKTGSVCSASGNERLCRSVKAICASKS